MLTEASSVLISPDQSTQSKPIIALISNCLSPLNRDFIRNSDNYCAEGVLKPYEFSYKGHQGMIPVLDILPTEMLSISGMKKAKKYFINAVKHASDKGVKVVLLAASTKRLFGDGTELKKLFPNILFTIGDNGTALAFLKQIEYVSKSISKKDPVIVLGAGFLGETAIQYLKEEGYQKIVVISKHRVISNETDLQFTSLDAYAESDAFEKASLFLGCAHNHNVTKQQLEHICKQQLIIIDVAVPNAVPKHLIDESDKRFARFDGGDYEIKNLELQFDHQLVGLNFKNEFYGCFTEAFLLAITKNKGDIDYFKVNKQNIAAVKNMFQKFGDDISVSHKSFGKTVTGFKDKLSFKI
ncbi:hypothetical protein ACXGQW_06665 [Wenyingzhuangia sp. IMCC45533]